MTTKRRELAPYETALLSLALQRLVERHQAKDGDPVIASAAAALRAEIDHSDVALAARASSAAA